MTLSNSFDLDGRVSATGNHAGLAAVLDLDYTYDLAGNVTKITDAGGGGRDRSYTYDALHRLTDASGGLPAESYGYDAVGNRTSATAGATAESYAYDTLSNRLLGVAVAGVPTRTLGYSGSGNTDADDDGAGRIAWSAIHRPFGETAHVGGQVTFNLRFPGQYHDAETGLHYNYHRDYDPTLGRYVQSDPIGLSGGWNTYAYVGGNPVMRVDPEGLLFCKYGISSQFLLCQNDAGEMVMLLGDENVHSGTNEGEYRCRNNDTCQFTKNIGPLPAGDYDIIPPRCSANYPTWVCLEPRTGTEVFKRDQFRIHPGRLSRGCITISPKQREVFDTIAQWAIADNGGTLRVNP